MSGVREAMIVAGGAGTRLWPLTATTPKPLLAFCGAPFLEGVLRRLAGIGIERVLLVVGADPSPFEVLGPAATELGIELEAVPEPEPLDTAGGVRSALDRVSGTFLVLNGDILTDVDLTIPIAAHRRAEAAATLVLTRVRDTSSYGVCVLEGSRIVGFVEKPPPGSLPGQDAVNAGTYVLEPAALAGFGSGRLSFEREVFPALVAAGEHVEGVVSDAVWADLGTPERYLAGHRLALDGSLRWPTLEDVPVRSPGVWVADDVVVDPSARLVRPVLLAAGARVGRDARVGPNAVLGPGATVRAQVRLEDVVLGTGARIGERSRLRSVATGAQATIGADVDAARAATIGDGERVADGARLPAAATVPDRR